MSDDDRQCKTIGNLKGIWGTEESFVGVFVNNRAAVRQVVSHLCPVLPVWASQLEKLDWVRLEIDGKVTEVHDGMEPGLGEDHPTDQLVEVDVVIQGQDRGQTQVPEACDGEAENQYQDHHGVEEESPATGSGQKVERVGGEAALCGEVSEVHRPLDKQGDVYSNQEQQEPDEWKIILYRLLAHGLGNFIHNSLF